MPINKIVKSKRSIAAITAAIIAATAGGWHTQRDTSIKTLPPAVILATDALIVPWEGLVLKSHWDQFAKIWDICYGQTRINGKPVTAGMSFTKAQCQVIAREQIFHDYYMPLVQRIKGFEKMPISVQAAMVSGAYNFGVNGMVNSTAAKKHMAGQYRAGCEAQTAWNKAGGQVVRGLVNRREMGDAQRQGEAELCVSGLK
ncbi:lysozyme [Agrobacterium sp. CG674]